MIKIMEDKKVLYEIKNEGSVEELKKAFEIKKEFSRFHSPLKIQLVPSTEQLEFLEKKYFKKNRKNKGKLEVYKYLHKTSKRIKTSSVYLNIYWEDGFNFEADAETKDAIASVTERIYRVRTPDKDRERIEGATNPLNPGWRCSLTGYWTKDVFDAIEILNSRHDYAWQVAGGLSWSVISVTTLDNVVIDEELKEKKKEGNASFDFHELFVVEVKDEEKVFNVTMI